MNTLKNVLLLNGVSSGATGILLVAFAKFFSDLFQVNQPMVFAGVGIFLLVFAAFVIMTAMRNSNRMRVQLIISLDVLWVLGSSVIVAADNSQMSMIGNILIVAVALWVAAMAFLQTRGLKQITL
jgi:hypothetical protein